MWNGEPAWMGQECASRKSATQCVRPVILLFYIRPPPASGARTPSFSWSAETGPGTRCCCLSLLSSDGGEHMAV